MLNTKNVKTGQILKYKCGALEFEAIKTSEALNQYGHISAIITKSGTTGWNRGHKINLGDRDLLSCKIIQQKMENYTIKAKNGSNISCQISKK